MDKSIGIVPDSAPDADATVVDLPDETPLGGPFADVEKDLKARGCIPEGWHLVSLNPRERAAIGDVEPSGPTP